MSESGMNTFIGHYISKLKVFFFSKNTLSFLLFLGISFSFWFINMLDKERETTLTIPLRYTGLPQNYNISKSNVEFITVDIKDKGINLFSYSKSKLNFLSVELKTDFKNRGKIIFTNDELRARLLKYLLPTTSILELKPDSLVLVYDQLAKKKVPVKFNGKIVTAQQYILSESIDIEPDSITVYGPKRVIERLMLVKTKWTELTEVDQNIHTNVLLQPIVDVRYSSNDVKLNVFAEMFTEKQLYFPVKVINCPDDLIVRTFPSQVKLTFNVAMSHFKTVTMNDIRVELDYFKLVNSPDEKQQLFVSTTVSYISNIRSELDEVEYVIERN